MLVFEIFWFYQNLRLRQPFESGYPKNTFATPFFETPIPWAPKDIFWHSKHIHLVPGFLMGTEMFEILPNLFPWQCWLTDFHRFWASIQMTISKAGMEFWKITILELIVLSTLTLGKGHQQLRKLSYDCSKNIFKGPYLRPQMKAF